MVEIPGGDADLSRGRLTARARPGLAPGAPEPGGRALGLGGVRDGLLHVPASRHPDRPAPLLLLLHGAGSGADRIMPRVLDAADATGTLVAAAESRERTWDMILGTYGPDVAFLGRVLGHLFGTCDIDPARIAIGGFSDGASYALSLGVANGDLFTHVMAFSPGFMAPAVREGTPRIFMSHGTDDEVLPIDRCSRRLEPALRHGGYDVRYVEFEGGHVMPRAIVRAAFDWFAA